MREPLIPRHGQLIVPAQFRASFRRCWLQMVTAALYFCCRAPPNDYPVDKEIEP